MKGVIFDLDGTMVDNMMVHHQAWQSKLRELGLDLGMDEVMEKVHGVNEEILVRLFGDRFSPAERARLSFEKEAEYRRIFKPTLKLIDGLPEFLHKLNEEELPVGIGSAAPPENVDFVLDTLEIRHHFRVVLNSNNVEFGKPHPEIYLKVADGLGLRPADCLVFEDSLVGAEAAERAGCPVVIVTTTHQRNEFVRFANIMMFVKDFKDVSIKALANEFSKK